MWSFILDFLILLCLSILFFCCFKHKTADEMRISDWSSDVCSSDLHRPTGVLDLAARANWKGFLKVAELACRVGLYTAASTSERISFHTLNRATGHRVSRQYVDQETGKPVERDDQRSEEHTSELQSLMRTSYAVFCLKKKKIQKTRSK